MSDAEYESREAGLQLWPIVIWLAIFVAGFGAFAFTVPQDSDGSSLMATLTFVAALLLVGAPLRLSALRVVDTHWLVSSSVAKPSRPSTVKTR